jgi:hypothetical protein
MNSFTAATLAIAGLLTLTACNRAEDSTEVAQDVADARQEAREDTAEARADAARVGAAASEDAREAGAELALTQAKGQQRKRAPKRQRRREPPFLHLDGRFK